MSNIIHTFRQSSGYVLRIFLYACLILISTFHSVPAQAATIPTSPQYVEAMAGANQVAVTWDPPASNGGEALTYTARVWSVPPPTTSPIVTTCSTNGLGCIASGLISGTSYYVDVVAINSAGTSAPSAMKPITPGSAGSPPTNVSAKSDSSGRLTISWTPSTALGTGQFAWYAAEVFTGADISAGGYKFYCTADPSTATTCLVVGLKLGSTYFVQVRTVTSLGSSYPSLPRIQVVAGSAATSPSPKNTPANTQARLPVPQQVKAVIKGGSVQISWKAPVPAKGKLVTGYTVTANNSSGRLITTCKTKAKVYSCLISTKNLKGVATFQVFALYGSGVLAGAKAVALKVSS